MGWANASRENWLDKGFIENCFGRMKKNFDVNRNNLQNPKLLIYIL